MDDQPRIRLTFPTSTSSRFVTLLHIAQQLADAGAAYTLEERPGRRRLAATLHTLSIPALTPPIATLLSDFAHTAQGLTGITLTLDGQTVSLYQAARLLDCYLHSCVPSDWRAHCWVSVPAPARDRARLPLTIAVRLTEDSSDASRRQDEEPRYWLFPCRLAQQSGYLDISPRHPATIRAQVEAAIARMGYAWCPRLRDLDVWELYQWGQTDDDGPPR